MRGPQKKLSVDEIRPFYEKGLTHDQMLAELPVKISRATLLKRLKEGGMVGQRSRPNRPATSSTRVKSRDVISKPANMPAASNPSILAGRSLYPSTIIDPAASKNLLISGTNHAKLGSKIVKGRWKGFPVFALTLEERATCPSSCRHWRSCFGNQMHLARRFKHGPDLEERLAIEVAALSYRHRDGFTVRLHVLGDFYSVAYVRLWRSLIERHPQLHAFGFSARHERSDPIAVELIKLVIDHWDRFAIRFSNAPVDECSTVSIEVESAAPDDVVVCPQQLGKTESCSTCAFCWQSKRRVGFIQH